MTADVWDDGAEYERYVGRWSAALETGTVFRDFDDYWGPFLGGQGPAPGYAMSLTTERRDRLR